MIRLPEDREIATNYFNNQSQHPLSKRNTSSFSKLSGCPTPPDIASYTAESKLSSPQKTKIRDCISKLYPQWHLELELGYNIFTYGYGSKVEALDKFLDTPLASNLHQFIFRGYRKDVSFAAFLELIEDAILSKKTQPIRNNPVAQVQRISNYLADPQCTAFDPFILVAIHQLDSPVLRSHQEAISLLASCPRIRLICTIDQANPFLMWTTAQFYGFKAIWHDITTMMSYKEELVRIIDGSHKSSASGNVSLESCQLVLQALPKNAQGIFKILVEHQLKCQNPSSKQVIKSKDDSDDEAEDDEEEEWETKAAQNGLSFYTWYQSAQEAFLANSEMAFRTQLVEFTDHQLVVGLDNPMASGQIYYLPFSADQLGKLLSFLS